MTINWVRGGISAGVGRFAGDPAHREILRTQFAGDEPFNPRAERPGFVEPVDDSLRKIVRRVLEDD